VVSRAEVDEALTIVVASLAEARDICLQRPGV